MADYYGAHDDSDMYPTIQERGPYRVFSQTHPLGNPAEVEAFLAQGERWVAAAGPVDVADMEPGHALNALQLILENAQRIAVVRSLAVGTYVDPAGDERARREAASTPLCQALAERAATSVESRPSWAR